MSTLFGAGVYKAGTDAVVKLSVNGSTDESDLVTVTRSTNSFEVNGSVIKLLGKAAGDARENISINLAYDTEAIVEKVSAFINDYNELLGSINKCSPRNLQDYPPLHRRRKKGAHRRNRCNQCQSAYGERHLPSAIAAELAAYIHRHRGLGPSPQSASPPASTREGQAL